MSKVHSHKIRTHTLTHAHTPTHPVGGRAGGFGYLGLIKSVWWGRLGGEGWVCRVQGCQGCPGWSWGGPLGSRVVQGGPRWSRVVQGVPRRRQEGWVCGGLFSPGSCGGASRSLLRCWCHFLPERETALYSLQVRRGSWDRMRRVQYLTYRSNPCSP